MSLCNVMAEDIRLPAGHEILITWEKTTIDVNRHHTKKEYLKIHETSVYKVHYQIKWSVLENTTQPLLITLYKIHTDFEIESLHQHVTVSVGNPVTLKKNFSFEFKAKERICLGVKNLSIAEFILMECQFSLSQ